MKRFLLLSVFTLPLVFQTASVQAMEETHEFLSVVHRPAAPRTIRGIYEDHIRSFRTELGQDQDAQGYNWKVPMTADHDLHLSLVTFAKGSYREAHVRVLRDLLSQTAGLVPHKGYFLRPELWLYKKQADGTVFRAHFVHPKDLTLTEQQEDVSQYYDPQVRSLDSLTTDFSADSGHIVLRYATQGDLSDGVENFVQALQRNTSGPAIVLEQNRDKYGSNLISHLSVARIIRCQGSTMSVQQEISGNSIDALNTAFRRFRGRFQKDATMTNPKKDDHKVVPYAVSEVHLTSGVRENRTTLHTKQ